MLKATKEGRAGVRGYKVIRDCATNHNAGQCPHSENVCTKRLRHICRLRSDAIEAHIRNCNEKGNVSFYREKNFYSIFIS